MINKRAIILFAVALILGIGAAMFANSWIQKKLQPVAANEENTSSVVVAALEISFGQSIEKEHIRLVEMPKSSIPDSAYSTLEEVEGKIANNFSPFVQAKLGPILAIDGNEEHRSFKNRWRKAPTIVTYGGQLVMGASFRQMSGSAISASIGYEFLPMGQTVDDKNNYDGMAINITWTFGLKRR